APRPESRQRREARERRDGRPEREPGTGGGRGAARRDRDAAPRGRGQPRRGRGRGRGREQQERPSQPLSVEGETSGWFDSARDGGYIRRLANSYLPDPGDAFVPPPMVRQFALRRGDAIRASVGSDQRGRSVVAEILEINNSPPDP